MCVYKEKLFQTSPELSRIDLGTEMYLTGSRKRVQNMESIHSLFTLFLIGLHNSKISYLFVGYSSRSSELFAII